MTPRGIARVPMSPFVADLACPDQGSLGGTSSVIAGKPFADHLNEASAKLITILWQSKVVRIVEPVQKFVDEVAAKPGAFSGLDQNGEKVCPQKRRAGRKIPRRPVDAVVILAAPMPPRVTSTGSRASRAIVATLFLPGLAGRDDNHIFHGGFNAE